MGREAIRREREDSIQDRQYINIHSYNLTYEKKIRHQTSEGSL